MRTAKPETPARSGAVRYGYGMLTEDHEEYSMNKARSTIVGGLLALASWSALAQTPTPSPPPPGRLLASNCFQCHGTNGSGGFERLAGMSASEIVNELREMRQEANPGIMEVHARGFNDQQLQALANYFAGLKATASSATSSSGTTSSGSTSSTSTKREKNDD